ncbi:MAG: hypothetical protein IJ746_04405 [Ruminococcus sp.]|nr:hypothetical protein [Ruminococcus sp.]
MSNDDLLIMSKDTVTAKWEDGRLIVVNEQLLPLFLRRVHNVYLWLETRAIDSHRANSRLLKKALRLKEKDDASTALKMNGATITDTYWVKSADSRLCYADVRFGDDYFSELALKGSYDSFNKAAERPDSRTPELTNTGSFEKCWKLKNGKWYMYKCATPDEQFTELFVCRLGRLLEMKMADYQLGDGCVISEDYTASASVNFEPALAFMGDNEDYEAVIEELNRLCPQAVPDYIRMIFLDTVCANPDRHTSNFGLLRDPDTGELLGLAPCFDHNMALISRGKPAMPTENDLLIKLFNEVIEDHPEYKQYIPLLTNEALQEAADIPVNADKGYAVELVKARYGLIRK